MEVQITAQSSLERSLAEYGLESPSPALLRPGPGPGPLSYELRTQLYVMHKKSPCRVGGAPKRKRTPARRVVPCTHRGSGRGGSDKMKPENLRRDSVACRCEAQRSRRCPPSAPSRAAQCSEEPGRAQHHTRKQLANGDARRHRVVVRRVRAAPCFRVRRQLRRGIGVSAGLLADE